MDLHQGLGYLRRAALISDSPQGPADCFVGWSPERKVRFAALFEEAMQKGILLQRPDQTSRQDQVPTEVPAKAQERVWTVQHSHSMGLRDRQVWDRVFQKLHLNLPESSRSSTDKKGKPKETKPRTSSRRQTKDKFKDKEKMRKVQEKAVEKFKRSREFQKAVHQAAMLIHDRWVLKTFEQSALKMNKFTMNLYAQAMKKDLQKKLQKKMKNAQICRSTSTSSQSPTSVYQVESI